MTSKSLNIPVWTSVPRRTEDNGELGIVISPGPYNNAVVVESQRCSIHIGDIIISVEGIDTHTVQDVVKALDIHANEADISLGLYRPRKLLYPICCSSSFTIKDGSMPSEHEGVEEKKINNWNYVHSLAIIFTATVVPILLDIRWTDVLKQCSY